MPRLTIRHETLYTYARPVRFGCWRLMMRPLDTHAARIRDTSLELSPPGDTRWSYDAYGNCICLFHPEGPAERLKVVSHLTIDRFPAPLGQPEAENPRSGYPIVYSHADRRVLEPFIAPDTSDADDRYLEWLRARLPTSGEPALAFLERLTRAIHADFDYGARETPGTQSPGETVQLGKGACRDFAWLMIESLRRLGIAARFVTGYLYSPRLARSNIRGAGATHAWCEVFLPDLGWLEFDPTNGLVESPSLIRVAATRTPAEACPMDGEVLDEAESELTVAVDVDLVEDSMRAA